MWHSHPTTRNEAVGESGKQGLISLVYLHLLSDSESPFGPLLCRCVCFMLNPVTVSSLEGNHVTASRDSSVVLETLQLYSRLISCTRKISTLHLEFKCVCVGGDGQDTISLRVVRNVCDGSS